MICTRRIHTATLLVSKWFHRLSGTRYGCR